jgi:predicted DCC family thiol-disulfide oxidoreductase YuxK
MPAVAPTPATPHLLLYDAACGLCQFSVLWLLAHDPAARLHFAPRHSALAGQIFARHNLDPSNLDSAVFITGLDTPQERIATHSDAILGCLKVLGGPWSALARLARLIPRALRDAAYSLLARNRIRLFGTADSCRLPTPAERLRFLDL